MIDEQTLERVVAFHGHMCPGLAMGIHAAEIARREIGPHAADEEVVAVVETDMCGVDAIQFLTGCTFGKGNLVHRDWGKNAYSFYRRSDGRAVRIAGRPDAWTAVPDSDDRVTMSRALLERNPDSLFTVTDIAGPPPRMARVFTSVTCERCGEGVMETRVRLLDGLSLCVPCFDAAIGGEEPVVVGRRPMTGDSLGPAGRGFAAGPP